MGEDMQVEKEYALYIMGASDLYGARNSRGLFEGRSSFLISQPKKYGVGLQKIVWNYRQAHSFISIYFERLRAHLCLEV